MQVTFTVTPPSIQDTNAIVPNGHPRISLDYVMRVVVVVVAAVGSKLNSQMRTFVFGKLLLLCNSVFGNSFF